eukprot:TRINITY_DN39586_c0_g1_i1.p1 TRINITY_DN39586_c0_g1~~TRINITY_DN39586_c0_g1_i1.p1  ORF type:complete len:373 (-),score=46.95 TRINITY_DN39586_c0_g1_i1:105-1223(-)
MGDGSDDGIPAQCYAAVLFYCLPLLAAVVVALVAPTQELRFLRRFAPADEAHAELADGSLDHSGDLAAGGAVAAVPPGSLGIKDGQPADSAPLSAKEDDGPAAPIQTWPPSLRDCFLHPKQLAVYSGTLVLAYAVVQLGAYRSCPLICRHDVEHKTTSMHFYNLLEVLGRSSLVFWLCDVARLPRVLLVVAFFEFLLTNGIYGNCSQYMGGSITSGGEEGSSRGELDKALAGTLFLGLVALVRLACSRLALFSNISFCCALGFFMILQFAMLAGATGFDSHLHHYHNGACVAMFCAFPNTASRLMVVKSLILLVEGIAIWSADPVLSSEGGDGQLGTSPTFSVVLFGLVYITLLAGTAFRTYQARQPNLESE